jgi:histidine triad (HIT) family protein
MYKFLLFSFLILIGCGTASASDSTHSYCAFCDPTVLEAQQFYADDFALVLYTHKPILPGHCLIIPRRHVERFEMLTQEEISRMMYLIKKVDQAVMKVFGTFSYLILQKNGEEVGQTVPHVHFHYIPRKMGDTSTFTFLFKMYTANIAGPISQETMQETTSRLREAMEEIMLVNP